MIVRESAHIGSLKRTDFLPSLRNGLRPLPLPHGRPGFGSLKRIDFFSFPHDDLGPLPFPYDQPEFGELDSILSKAISRVGRKVKKVVKKVVGKRIAKAATRVGKKIHKVAKKAGRPAMKVFKKYFPKIAPALALAAQILNIVPGLGVAVGLAISIGGASMTMRQNIKAMKKGAKLSKEQEAVADAEAADLDRQANESLDGAYAKGEQLFTTEYEMPRDRWDALSIEGKTRFLREAVAIANQKKLLQTGVTPEKFSQMTIEEQDKVLEETFGMSPWTLAAITGGGVLLVVGLALLLKSKKE